jgi:uncharacterized repeat protein (TIGR03803 family)
MVVNVMSSSALTTLVDFNTASGGPGYAYADGLIADPNGNLFGVTTWGGSLDEGAIFEIPKTPSGYATPVTIASFNGSDGSFPYSGVVMDAQGDLFGTTTTGGAFGKGSVYEIAKTSSSTYNSSPITLVSFNGSNGSLPAGGLMIDANGSLFGTTELGGSNGGGTVFEVAKSSSGYSSALMTLTNFNGADGATPAGTLIANAAGDLFGTTVNGGNGSGTVFEIQNTSLGYASTPTTLVSFNSSDGALPYSGLVSDATGDLFGTTWAGGLSFGTVFEIPKTDSASGYASTPSTLVNFSGTNGANPYAGLIIDANGNLFGTTAGGGSSGTGTVFEISKGTSGYSSTLSTVANFNGTNGSYPYATLFADGTGDLFGTTWSGGTNNVGTVFGIDGTDFAEISLQTLQLDASKPDMQLSLLYQSAFGRLPDVGGLAYWKGEESSGVLTLQQIAQYFADSPEFAARYGALDANDFVTQMYENALDRAPDQGGFNYWTSGLNSGSFSKGYVLLGFAESPENLQLHGPDITKGGFLGV